MRALGIDPGTKNFDLCCIEDSVDNVVLDKSISTEIVAKNPDHVFEIIKSTESDVIVGPSGYGLEFKHTSEFTEKDVATAKVIWVIEPKPTCSGILCFKLRVTFSFISYFLRNLVMDCLHIALLSP